MDVLLYPYHTLPPFQEEPGPESREVAISAALLYFDTITLGRPGYPDELEPGSVESAMEEMRAIDERRGQDVVNMFLREGSHEGLSVDELAGLTFLRYWYNEQKFRKSYAPLLQSGVIRTLSLASITAKARESAGRDSEAAQVLHMNSVLAGHLASEDRIKNWPSGDAEMADYSAAFSDADGIGLGCMYLRSILKKSGQQGYLAATSQSAKQTFLRRAFLLDVFHQSVLSTMLGVSRASFENVHLHLQSRYISKIQSTADASIDDSAENARLAFRLFSETLNQVPAIIPRSPEAICELRTILAEELSAFRHAIKNASADFLHEKRGSPPDERTIKHLAEKHFLRPLESLNRRLAHPNRELLRNLVSTNSVVFGGVALGMAFMANLAGALTAVMGISIAALTGALKTRFDRQKEIEQSDVGFLIRARKYS